MRFQVLFHSPPGVLFTFPSRYLFTIGRQEYLALDGGPPGFPHERPSTWYSGTRPGVGSLSRTGLSPSTAGLSMPLRLTIRFVTPCGTRSPRGPALQHRDCNGCDLSRSHGLGSSLFARHYSGNVSLLLQVLRCFSSLGFLAATYVFSRAYPGITPGGFPHSDTSGSKLARSSPERFVACHVLLRLLAPRHPPRALSSLT
jgi:hypothetical protein